jgi:hypothetical protein
MKKEIWKKHPDMSKYEFSNFGNFRNIETGKDLKKSLYKGYVRTMLYNDKLGVRKGVKLHRIVAMLFLDPVEGKFDVNHKDGNKSNNHYTNLEWVTNQENIQHSIETGLRKRSPAQKLSEDNVREIRKLYDTTNISTTYLGSKYNINPTSVLFVLKYKSYSNIDPEKKYQYKINSLQNEELEAFYASKQKFKAT